MNVPVAYRNPPPGRTGPWSTGASSCPRRDPVSNVVYTVKGGKVTKGYVISGDDEFSADGNVVYTVNAVNVVKATNQATLAGPAPARRSRQGPTRTRSTTTTSLATTQPPGSPTTPPTKQFTVTYNGTARDLHRRAAPTVTDNRHPTTPSRPHLRYGGHLHGHRQRASPSASTHSANNPITAGFPYANHFFVDAITGHHLLHRHHREPRRGHLLPAGDHAVRLCPRRRQHLPDPLQRRQRRLPGDRRRAGQCRRRDRRLGHLHHPDRPGDTGRGRRGHQGEPQLLRDQRQPLHHHRHAGRGRLLGLPGRRRRHVAPMPFTSANTFKLTDPAITYTLQLDDNNLPTAVLATFPVRPSRDLISVDDDIYIITYNTVSTGSLLGQGQARSPSATPLHAHQSLRRHEGEVHLRRPQHLRRGSVVGQFTVYPAPTFFLGPPPTRSTRSTLW